MSSFTTCISCYISTHTRCYIKVNRTTNTGGFVNINNDLYFLDGKRHFEFGVYNINLTTSFARYDFNFKTTYDYAPVVIVTLCNVNTSAVAYNLITVNKTGFVIGGQTNAPTTFILNYIAI